MKGEQMTLKSQWGLSAENSTKRASIAAGTTDTQKHTRHLHTSSYEIFINLCQQSTIPSC